MNDVAISLIGGLTDSTLAPGQKAAFRIELPDIDNNNTFAIDNVAITGTLAPVPEPATYAILAGFATLGLVLYRRRRLD
jgi:hypothetical protein